jgi:hypothetical protein
MREPFDKEAQAAARRVVESIPKIEVPYERLRGDIELAQRLLGETLSSDTKPTEKEARAAARKVLETIAREYYARDQHSRTHPNRPYTFLPTISTFLFTLANAIDPASMPEAAKTWTQQIKFKDVSTGAKRTRAAFRKHFNIAREVFWLNEQGKPGVSLVAKKYNMDSSQISRICTQPHVKGAVEAWYEELKAKALLGALERAAKGETLGT